MQKDERDLLEVLKFELEFLEDGGYGRSPQNALETSVYLRRLSHLHELRFQRESRSVQ